MEAEENIVNPRRPGQEVRGCYRANLILNAFVALCLGIAIILILNVFNRGGWFALLSGLLGTLLYCAIAFPRILFGPRPGPGRYHRGDRDHGEIREEQGDRSTAKRIVLGGIMIPCILAVGAGVGLYYLPTNQPIFALMDAILAIAMCVALLWLGLYLLIFFFGRGRIEEHRGHIDL